MGVHRHDRSSAARPRQRPRLVLPALLGLLGLLLAGCAPLGPTGAKLEGDRLTDLRPVRPGGTLQIALASDPDRLDPTRSSTLVARQVFASMCEKLYDLDQNLQIVPQLAAAPATISADQKTVTIPIRQGLKFADGTVMDAAAVKTSLDRHLTLKTSGRRSELANVASINAPDPGTVVLKLKQPDASLLSVLADRAGMVMSPKALTELGDEFSQRPVCIGAFRFSERIPGDRIVLDKDPNYYAADQVGLQQVVYRIITDGSVRLSNLRSRDVQVGDQMDPVSVGSMAGDNALQLFSSGSLGYQGIYFNLNNANGIGNPPGPVNSAMAGDKRLRQAFSLAIDRNLLNTIVFQGLYQPACTPIAPGTEYADPAQSACAPRDLQRARQLIAETGVPTPIPLELTIPNTPESSRIGQVIQAMTAEAGFEVKLRPMEFASSLSTSQDGQFQALAAGWSGRIDPDGNITRFVKTGAANNYSGYGNPQVDDMIKKGVATNDTAARRDIYKQLIDLVADDAPLIYLYRQSNLVVATQQISGIRVYRDGIIRITEAGYTS